MLPVDFELVRQLQAERKSEAAAYRLVRCLPEAESSRATLWLSFPGPRELIARIRDFVGLAANRAESVAKWRTTVTRQASTCV